MTQQRISSDGEVRITDDGEDAAEFHPGKDS